MDNTLDLDLQVARYLDKTLNLFAQIEMGQPSHAGNSITYIMQPLQKVKNYYNGRQKRTFSFVIQAKHSSWREAVKALNQINLAMQHANRRLIKSANDTFLFANAEMVLTPRYVGLVTDTKQPSNIEYAIYQATFNVAALINL
ncbi:hypothetical protein DS831_04700 [Bombilactobacillus bombi]|uniref:Minor capsid protein n=1 Tax=Bombilactobacillus bombi TaxID=1303590 RepID=A0A3R7CPQ6_9LACO|nr:hypothetical protein [Bombilactobacillus bombi]QHJ80380.1 MAG: hypothetical protein [Bacteriophage sp.]RHW51324.1 hypothetical protein DS831_04700 [Bombilactobacillus bombi]